MPTVTRRGFVGLLIAGACLPIRLITGRKYWWVWKPPPTAKRMQYTEQLVVVQTGRRSDGCYFYVAQRVHDDDYDTPEKQTACHQIGELSLDTYLDPACGCRVGHVCALPVHRGMAGLDADGNPLDPPLPEEDDDAA